MVTESSEETTLQCMEVWGGNSAVERTVQMPGIRAWVYSRPFGGEPGGGDVYYLSSCATGRITRLLLADVSGHGAAVSSIAEQLRFMMRRFVNCLDQSRFVERLNSEFVGAATDGNFATAIAATFWAPTQYFVACNAGHPRPLVYRHSARRWTRFDSPASESDAPIDLPLGVMDGVEYTQVGTRLDTGDAMLFYTDALIEAADDTGLQVGELGLLGAADAIPDEPGAGFASSLVRAVLRRTAGASLTDDATLLLVRATGESAAAPDVGSVVASLTEFFTLLGQRLIGRRVPVPWPEFSVPNLLGPFLAAANRSFRDRSPPRDH